MGVWSRALLGPGIGQASLGATPLDEVVELRHRPLGLVKQDLGAQESRGIRDLPPHDPRGWGPYPLRQEPENALSSPT